MVCRPGWAEGAAGSCGPSPEVWPGLVRPGEGIDPGLSGWWAWGTVLRAGLRALGVSMEAKSQDLCLNCTFFLLSLGRQSSLPGCGSYSEDQKDQRVMRVGSEHCQQGGGLFPSACGVGGETQRMALRSVILDWRHLD